MADSGLLGAIGIRSYLNKKAVPLTAKNSLETLGTVGVFCFLAGERDSEDGTGLPQSLSFTNNEFGGWLVEGQLTSISCDGQGSIPF